MKKPTRSEEIHYREFHQYKLQPDEFYWENGAVVLTETYHLRRGSCCKYGCKNCPYKGQKTCKGNANTDSNQEN